MKLSGLCVVACVLLVSACQHEASQYARPGDDPHDTDSLYVLYHEILSDSDPVTVWSETVCEMSRLMDKLGPDVASRRIKAVTETAYTRAERRRRDEVDPQLWYHAFPLGNASCASGFSNKYDPKLKIDTAHNTLPPTLR